MDQNLSMALCVFLIFVLAVIVYKIGKNIKLPIWAKWKSTTLWRISFFDKNTWLKAIVIKLAQGLVVIFLLVILAIKFAFATASRIIFPKKLTL
ncbi:hypothetical protein CVU82_02780 [Candidatus Falkowbacteria bacterium HGW-Falkowbacteria-1]|jgi:hypothetical protein|uniref:Uncharacterized protein n=1 Tax=Candidatus Falkowbacteria bacterium HGW-Falkowbacteria-1 TaxID=2013768 RepID=A0A2N2E9V5_9BACT|nr:MAG: hypothetical protein CVU82_02780 [Candidatus Falkowbacteria bacterium HGW-Falkowbacteria-1]